MSIVRTVKLGLIGFTSTAVVMFGVAALIGTGPFT